MWVSKKPEIEQILLEYINKAEEEEAQLLEQQLEYIDKTFDELKQSKNRKKWWHLGK